MLLLQNCINPEMMLKFRGLIEKLAIILRTKRNSICIVVMLQKFSFQFCHINIPRTFTFTTFTTQTQTHDVVYFFMVVSDSFLLKCVKNSRKILALALVVSFSLRVAM